MSAKDHPGVKIPPPLIYLGFTAIGLLLNKLYPWPIAELFWLRYVGAAIIVLSASGLIYLIWLFRKYETEIEPWRPASKLIIRGPYRFSRNPVYVLLSGVPLGAGLFFNSLWALLAVLPCMLGVYYAAIRKEEKYLEKKFGDQYLEYRSKVRRWL